MGTANIDTGIGFDHMLTALLRCSQRHQHGHLPVKGTSMDGHHTVEDTGIVLGKALGEALGDKSGITLQQRFIPMDEALAFCSLTSATVRFWYFRGRSPML